MWLNRLFQDQSQVRPAGGQSQPKDDLQTPLERSSRRRSRHARGEVSEGERVAQEAFEATYLNHYVAMRRSKPTPLCQSRKRSGNRLGIDQRPFGAKEEVAQALGSPQKMSRSSLPLWEVDLVERVRTGRSWRRHAFQNLQEDLFRWPGAEKKSSSMIPSGRRRS